MFKLVSLNMRMATPEDAHLEAYDNTKLSNVNTCPTWGILRYSHHKTMPGASRALPLEAGSAAHEAFAAVRLYWFGSKDTTTIVHDQYLHHGSRLFGPDRFNGMLHTLNLDSTNRTNCINFALEALETCGYYDDITDRNRTISNISEGVIAYIDAYDPDRYSIWVRDPNDPKSDIGIEIAYDIVIDIEYEADVRIHDKKRHPRHLQVRFTGKLDCLQHDPKYNNRLEIVDDKTGSRLDDNWLSQWITSNQLTGYCLAASTFTGQPCHHAQAWGMKIPLGKISAEGIRREQVNRNNEMYSKWAGWFVDTVEVERRWRDHVLDAPQYTHSCNRYFRTCSFLPLCAAESREEKELILSEMEIDEWSPLHE
jgi:hypothetical protein